MNVDIFGSDGKGTTKTADKNYVDLQFITLVKNLATKIDKSYVDEAIQNAIGEISTLIDLKVDKVATRIDGDFATLNTNLATKVNKTGDIMSENFNILISEDNLRTFGVTDINSGRSVSLLLGDIDNQIRHNFGHAIKVAATHGTKFTCPAGDVCQLGEQTNAEAKFFNDIDMKENRIANLHNPIEDQDAATKNYVDMRCIKNNVGYVPNLVTNDTNKTGFIVSASSEDGQDFQAFNVFNSWGGEWHPAPGINKDVWIELKCPERIKIYKFTLRGIQNKAENISGWRLQGSNGDNIWVDLYKGNGEHIDYQFKTFHVISTVEYYLFYRIYVRRASANPGLSHWQIYSVDSILKLLPH